MEVKFHEMNLIMEGTDALYHEAAKRLGLSDADFDILYSLVEAGGSIPQKKIYLETGISKSTINSAIKKLEREGILAIKALDGRSTEICFTEKGRRFSVETVEKVIEIENNIYDGWSEEEKEIVLRLNRDFMEKFALEVERL